MNATILKRGLAAVAFSALLTLAVGCGSDNNPTGANGSLSDPAFLEVQPQVNTFFDSVFVAFSAGLSSYNEVPITDGQIKLFYGPGIPGGVNQSTYEYTPEGWHHITTTISNDAMILGVNDSIQFKNGQTAQESSTGADALDYRHHWAVTQRDKTADFTDLSGDVGFLFSNLNTTGAMIDGSYAYTVKQRTVDTNAVITDNDFAFTSVASNVGVPQPTGGIWGAGCPTAGAVTFAVNQVKIVTNGSTVDTTTTAWTGSASFASGSAGIRITDGATSWTYTLNVCSPAL